MTGIPGPRDSPAKRMVLSVARMTIHNGPGLRNVIYFKGCPLRCRWCSTPESQNIAKELAVYSAKCIHCDQCVAACPLHAITVTSQSVKVDRSICNNCGKCAEVCNSESLRLLGRPMTVEELVVEAKKDVLFYRRSGGGVVLSGGEPLLSPDFTLRLVQALREEGISVGVDTSGHVPWANIDPILPHVDFFLWDIKHMDPERHRQLTGVHNELILANARLLSQKHAPIYVRFPVIPGCNDSEDNIRATCAFAVGLSSVVEFDLIPLHHLGKTRYESLDRPYGIANLRLVPDAVLQDMKRLVESYGLNCTIQA